VTSICLSMIVKDESAVIERCISSVRGLIDSWVICDTGSTDGTQALIESALDGVPGELHERPWRNFGENRTEAIRLAAGRGDYLLLIDADMTVTYDRAGLGELSADAYMLRHAEELEYRIKRLVRSDRSWRYVGATHEYLTSDGPETVESLDAIVIHHHADSGTRAEKFERDLRLLSAEVDEDPSNSRAVFYLALTHRDLGELDEAIELYERRATMGGFDEEVFYSLLQVGVLRAERGDWPAGMASLVVAWEHRPQRLEPLYELASRLRMRGQHHTAHVFAKRGLGRPQPPDILFVSPWVYRWGLLFEYSIAAYWVGEADQALAACNRLLGIRDLPEPYRQQTLVNRRYCLERLSTTQAHRGEDVSERRTERARGRPA
jgi:glycosyltransferase involved in cell wall biosynthesis